MRIYRGERIRFGFWGYGIHRKALIATILLFLATGSGAGALQRNILLIIADDYGIDSSSLYTASEAGVVLPPTPNINALRAEGVLFRNAYVQPTCSPTRACLITGRQPFRTGSPRRPRPATANCSRRSLPSREPLPRTLRWATRLLHLANGTSHWVPASLRTPATSAVGRTIPAA